ncbi:ribonuclease 2-like isoform X1 [Coffea eugenioides]|uniref:ribonuclease 2-like isoform X1 n=1 Tax=Coffea eugenioides TaxID=49369 RepID=UPI000F6056E1|nr:ribonuclease 2-like isoform X1 [Coffea eugenioides]
MAFLPIQIVVLMQLLMILVASLCLMKINGVDLGEELTGGVHGGGSGQEQREFDYFKLALQWPGTICQGNHRCCASNGCCQGSNSLSEFTIHGLWPDYNDGSWPACCNGPRYDSKEVLCLTMLCFGHEHAFNRTSIQNTISTLTDVLKKYWPSLSCSKSSTCHGGKGTFWAHEWEKHGTCCSPVIRDEYSYFLTAINVYSKYNVTQVLNEAGYLPSNSEKYPLGGIIAAIQNAFHATPELQCKGGAVEELRLCFFKDFKPRDCISEPHIESYLVASSSCPKYVSLPDVQASSRYADTRVAF